MNKLPELLDQLAQDARRLRVGQALPETGKLPPAQIRAVQDDLRFMLDRPGVTIAKVAEALGDGFSRGSLSRFLNAEPEADQSTADLDRIARGVNAFLETLARRSESRGPAGFVETVAAKRMLTVIEKTIELCAVGLIVGDAGRGKSMTLQAAKDIWPGTLLIRIRQSSRTPTGLARQLADVLRLRCRSLRGPEVQSRVIEALAGTGRALLIDEAHQLKHEALEFLRDVHDETGCPIILAGTIRLADAVSDTETFFGQFASRIALRLDLTEQIAAEAGGGGDGGPKPLHSVDEIRRLYADKVRFTDDGLMLLQRIANLPGLGGLRLCSKVAQVAASAARSNGAEAIDAKLIVQVMRMLYGKRYSVGSIERAVEQSCAMVA